MENQKIPVPKADNPEDLCSQFITLVEIIRILRQHCPWDKRQTNESIAHLLIEETYEMIDAIHQKNDEDFSKELGDILLHVIMHSIMAQERSAFDLMDVIKKIQEKLIHRHPHVFGDINVSGEEEVMQNWEALKSRENNDASLLDGVPKNLPSLLRAERIQHKASRVGFDWEDKKDVWDKVFEEVQELRNEIINNNKKNLSEEIGDLLFSIVNASRFENVVAEEALQLTNDKFTRRFKFIEQKAKEKGKNLKELTLKEMDEIWNEAKNLKI